MAKPIRQGRLWTTNDPSQDAGSPTCGFTKRNLELRASLSLASPIGPPLGKQQATTSGRHGAQVDCLDDFRRATVAVARPSAATLRGRSQ